MFNSANVVGFSTVASVQALGASASLYTNVLIAANGINYVWNPSSTTSPDGVLVIQATGVTTGRYLAVTLPMTQQFFNTGTALTYHTPTGCIQLRITLRGGGGGGGGFGTTSLGVGIVGAAGTDTIFNSIHAGAGQGGPFGPASFSNARGGAAGHGGTGSTNVIQRISGFPGEGSQGADGTIIPGTLGGQGGGAGGGLADSAAMVGDGAGGGGGSISGTTGTPGSGGGQGEWVLMVINTPASTYTYTVGTGGAGGMNASGTFAGAGVAGWILVEEIYG